MDENQTNTIVALLEIALSGQWPRAKRELLSLGYTPEAVIDATTALCVMADCEPFLSARDF